MTEPALSIIIPTINEVATLPPLLDKLEQQKGIKLEIIVADGGSTDGTADLIRARGIKFVNCEKGRARQLNAGVGLATHSTLLFLHADSELRDNFFLSRALIVFNKAVSVQENTAGHFALDFIQTTDRHQRAFRYLSEKTTTNRLYTINGDQGLLISRKFFQKLGGYNENLPVMEDQEIAAKIFEQGQWILLPGHLMTSGRRFEREGFHRRYILMSLMMGLYWTGAKEFFNRAGNIYADQDKTAQLKLWPYFRCIWQMLIYDFGIWKSVVQWYKVGRYVRQNSWQLFFFLDVVLRTEHRPLTRFHDRIIFPLTNNVIFNVLITPLVFFWYMLLLGPFFYLAER